MSIRYAPKGTPPELMKKVFEGVTKGLQHSGIKSALLFREWTFTPPSQWMLLTWN